jgi:ABC-type lipoprotein release transport system permease subunit
MVTLKIAWRDIMRQRSRTWLTIAAITFCTVSLLLTMALTRGMHQQMIQSGARAFTGHFQVQKKGYLEKPTLYNTFALPGQAVDALESDKRVEGVAPRVLSEGLASSDDTTAGVIIVGVDPVREAKATTLAKSVRKGSFLDINDSQGVVLGVTLAENLKVDVGGEIQIMLQSFYGSLQLRFYKVAGVVGTGSPDFDQALLIMPLAELQSFLDMEDKISHVAVVLKNPRVRPWVMAKAQDLLDGLDGEGLVLVKWEKITPELYEYVMLDNAGGVLYLAILVIVVAFVVLLTITMSVLERIPEFGVQLAIGARPSTIFKIVMTESFLMGAVGIALGLLIASGPAYYWSVHPIYIESYAEAFKEFGMKPEISTILLPVMYMATFMIMMVITMGVSIFPAVRASRIKPVDALRYV